MDSKDRNVIIYNYNFKKEEKVKYLKFEELFSSDDSVSSDNSLEDKTFGDTHKNHNMLPLKKFQISVHRKDPRPIIFAEVKLNNRSTKPLQILEVPLTWTWTVAPCPRRLALQEGHGEKVWNFPLWFQPGPKNNTLWTYQNAAWQY